MKPTTKILNERDKVLFEKALKFYFFSRQQDVQKLNSELQQRLSYSGQVAYSLIITFLREEKLKIEYMDFLNEEIKTLRSLNSSHLQKLQVKPHEIDEIELNNRLSIKVFDEDNNRNLEISYQPDSGTVQLTELN